MSNSLLVIGSSNVDLIMQNERLPKPGETVTGGVFHQTYGGKGANQAVGAARSGAKVQFISRLGDDGFGPDFIKNFQKDGIETTHVSLDPVHATGTALIMIDQQGENCISVAPGANYSLNASHIDAAADAIKAAGMVLMQCEIHPDTLAYTIEQCHDKGKKIILNLAPAIPLSADLLSKLHLLVVNESEAAFLCERNIGNVNSAQAAAISLAKKYGIDVILTLGKEGALLVQHNQVQHIATYSVKAIDSTAAGDVFCGALATALLEGKAAEAAVRFASAAAAISVTKLGAQDSAPNRDEINRFIARQKPASSSNLA